MCEVSAYLKLCTCNSENVEGFPHYWLLQRAPEEHAIIVGQALLPADIGDEANQLNETTIEKALNERNCFDIDVKPQENDLLHLYFTYRPDFSDPILHSNDYIAYAFKYIHHLWQVVPYEPFDSVSDIIQKGKIESPFTSK